MEGNPFDPEDGPNRPGRAQLPDLKNPNRINFGGVVASVIIGHGIYAVPAKNLFVNGVRLTNLVIEQYQALQAAAAKSDFRAPVSRAEILLLTMHRAASYVRPLCGGTFDGVPYVDLRDFLSDESLRTVRELRDAIMHMDERLTTNPKRKPMGETNVVGLYQHHVGFAGQQLAYSDLRDGIDTLHKVVKELGGLEDVTYKNP